MRRRFGRQAILAGAAILLGSIAARAYDTTWVTTGQQVSAVKLKADLDEIQSRLSVLESGVTVRYSTSSAQTLAPSAYTVINFDTKAYDATNAVTTGPGWKFTAPSAGKYRVAAFVEAGGTVSSGNVAQLVLGINTESVETVMLDTFRVPSSGVTTETGGSTTIALNAGDTVSVMLWHNCTTLSLNQSASRAWVTIDRVAN